MTRQDKTRQDCGQVFKIFRAEDLEPLELLDDRLN
jgi:hypothetical protein